MADEIILISCNSVPSSPDLKELEAIKARVREMEAETEKLKKMQDDLAKQMNTRRAPGSAGRAPASTEEKMAADARSVFVGNVDYGATAEELGALFQGCGPVSRVTLLCDKASGHPKGFAYVEFSDKESVKASLALDASLFRGRQIRVTPKRTNRPGFSAAGPGFPGAARRAPRGGGGGGGRGGPRCRAAFHGRPRGRGCGGRARAASWWSPY
nr:polyadenylate-binding protein 2-like [Dasypus novemcinctus]